MRRSLAGRAETPTQARLLAELWDEGPISVECRLVGAPEALAFVRRLAFDAAFATTD